MLKRSIIFILHQSNFILILSFIFVVNLLLSLNTSALLFVVITLMFGFGYLLLADNFYNTLKNNIGKMFLSYSVSQAELKKVLCEGLETRKLVIRLQDAQFSGTSSISVLHQRPYTFVDMQAKSYIFKFWMLAYKVLVIAVLNSKTPTYLVKEDFSLLSVRKFTESARR